MAGPHGKFRKVPLRLDEGDNIEVYARVYEDGTIQLVGRNVKLDFKQGAYGRGPTEQWAFGDNWHITTNPWEASSKETGGAFTPEQGE